MQVKYLTILFFLFCCYSCQKEVPKKEKTATKTTESLDGTVKMVQLLQQTYQQIDPMKVSYFDNESRAKTMKARLDNTTNLGQKLTGQLFYGYELMAAGNNEGAIRELAAVQEQMKKIEGNEKVKKEILRLLALAYIRLGEQNNCIDRTTDESCLMPITEKGVYAMRTAVNTAIGHYEELLAQYPDDLESIWMLNFAYMTLGEYPEKVPAKYLLAPQFFQSKASIPPFQNISQKVGLGTVGLSGGMAIDDFNNDGNLDIIASSWGLQDQIHFFVNDGKGSFTDVTKKANLEGITGGLHLTHADYNNDGFLDVFVLRGAWFGIQGKIPNSLLKNNGDGTFSDVTEEAGLLSFAPTQTATWADFNLDGHVDLFIGNESAKEAQFPCELYINNGNGTFSNQTERSGLHQLVGMIKGVTAGDVNNDGTPDLYFSLLGYENFLLLNLGVKNGNVTFVDASEKAQVKEPVFSFPTWMWDMNNDGWQDLMVACFSTSYSAGNSSGKKNPAALVAASAKGEDVGANPHFFMNNQDGTFTEKAKSFGVQEPVFAMGSNFGDIDNDGFLDAYYGTGAPSFTAIVPNKMYKNKNGKSLLDVTTAGKVGHIQKGHGVGFGDIDNDGDQDIFCVLGGAFSGDIFADALFLNPAGNQKNWVSLQLEGTTSNRAAIGAKVHLITDKNQHIYRWVNTGGSFGGNSLQLEIGVGTAEKIQKIEVTWPNLAQSKEVFENVAINQFYKIKEGAVIQILQKNKIAL